jgi:hypothetical protein
MRIGNGERHETAGSAYVSPPDASRTVDNTNSRCSGLPNICPILSHRPPERMASLAANSCVSLERPIRRIGQRNLF